MSWLKKIGKSAKAVQKQNVFEAIVAAIVLLAAASGETGEKISKKEADKADKLLANNDTLSAFKPAEKRRLVDKYAGLMDADFRLGKSKLLKEIADVADNSDDAEEVFINALSMAEADGEIDDAEKVMLADIAKILGVNLAAYGIA